MSWMHPEPHLWVSDACYCSSFGFGSVQPQTRTPRLTIRCEYPDTLMPPTEVTFCLSPDYGINSAPSRDSTYATPRLPGGFVRPDGALCFTRHLAHRPHAGMRETDAISPDAPR